MKLRPALQLTALLFSLLFCPLLVSQTILPGMQARDSIWSRDVKSVFLELNDTAVERPFIKLNSDDRLLLRFDVLDNTPGDFRYRIHHCDKDWRVDDASPFDFINGFEEDNIADYQYSFTTLQNYIHYQQRLPGTTSRFILSGNYLLEVHLQNHPDSIILTRRFCVYEGLLDINIDVDKPMSGLGDMRRDQEVNVSVGVRQGEHIFNPTASLTIKVQQNRRIDNIHTLAFSGHEGLRMTYRWQAANLFPGGNCFRYFDCSNLRTAMYNVADIERYGGEIFAILKPLEDRSRNAYIFEQSLNGGMKINAWDRSNPEIEADYMEVNFTLPMPKPFLSGNVYIVGDLTDWSFNENSRMEWRPEYNAYFKRMKLKQGYYSYQLLVVPTGETEGSTYYLEGNHFETPNHYTVFAYLRQPTDRYDRLAGIKVLK